MRTILRLLATAGALAVATWLLSGITLNDPTTSGKILALLIVALIFGVLNAIVKPIFKLVTLPIVLLTLGLFLLVINAALLGITAAISARFSVDGFWSAIAGGFLIALFSWIAELLLPLKVRAS